MELFTALTALVLGLVLVYWRIVRKSGASASNGYGWLVTALVAVGWILCGGSVALEKRAHSYVRTGEPLAVAVAFDLSPSMLAVPDPRRAPGYDPRFERGRNTLLAFFEGLEERREAPLVAMVGFTRDAEILMGWDRSYSRIREVLHYALSPDLFASSGTSIESAVRRVEDVFEMLPQESRSATRKLVILVSDGEDTTRSSSPERAAESLASGDYEVIAVQTGLLRVREGVPRPGQLGEIRDFRRFGGRHFTVPDIAAMRTIAEAGAWQGLYVRAEDPQAAARMLQLVAPAGRRAAAADASLLVSLGLFIVVAGLCAVLVK